MTEGGLPPVDLALVVAYAGFLLFLAFRRGREDRSAAGEYLLAGRSLTAPAFVATLVSTWYGGVLGVGEYSYSYGLSNWLALGGPYYLTGLVFALVLARRARESSLVTVPERLLRDHGALAGTLGAALVFVNMLPAPYLLMLGVLTERSLGVGLTSGVVIAAVFSAVCVVGGGFRSVVRTNALQFVLMYGGFVVILPVALYQIGGFGAFTQLPEEHLTWDGGLGLQAILVWYVIAMQALVEPTFYQRCYAAKDPGTARRGILWSVVFWIIFDALTTTTGMAARVLLPNLDNPVEAYPALADAVLPTVLRGLFYVGLIATVMSTVESYLFVAATTLGFDLPAAWRAVGTPLGTRPKPPVGTRPNPPAGTRPKPAVGTRPKVPQGPEVGPPTSAGTPAETEPNPPVGTRPKPPVGTRPKVPQGPEVGPPTPEAPPPDIIPTPASELVHRRGTRLGLVIATVVSVVLALASQSVVALWKGIGSVITPALLLPLIGGFIPRLRASRAATLTSMVGSTVIAIAWMAPAWLGGAHPFGWEPIFPALAWSLLCHLPSWLARGRHS